jgi:hypothetical protein
MIKRTIIAAICLLINTAYSQVKSQCPPGLYFLQRAVAIFANIVRNVVATAKNEIRVLHKLTISGALTNTI